MEEIGLRPNRPNSDIPVEDVLKLRQAGIFGSTKNRSHDSGVKLKPPTFNGKLDPKHFFVKLLSYVETYKIRAYDQRI